jgi:hypothetical protein
MFSFRLKTGRNAASELGGSISVGAKALGRTIGQAPPSVKPSEEDGDGDGFRTGPDGRDNIPVTKLPEILTTEALKKMRSDINPDFLNREKSPQKDDGDEMLSAEELMKLPAENSHNLSLLDEESSDYLDNQRKINSGYMNQRVRKDGVFMPIILREWADGTRSIFDGHHRLIAAYDNHPNFQVPVFVWKEEGNMEDEFKSLVRQLTGLEVKILGAPIGGLGDPSDFDGDGDGFLTGPDGRDNIPAPTQVVDNLKGAWNKLREKKMAGDEARAIKAANLVKGKKPKTPQEINQLLRGARTREDVVEARKNVREWAESIFAFDGLGDDGSNKVVIFKGKTGVNIVGRKREVPSVNDQDPDEPYLHIRISGKIVDKDGKEVGLFERRVFLDDYNAAKKPHIYNEILRMQPEARGKGIGADFTLASEAQYAAMGLDEMRLNAGLADGVYTWLRAGYRFKNDKERIDFAETIEKRYQAMLKDAGSKENLIKGGFMTSVGGRAFDDDKTVKMPEPLFESMEQLELFLKFLGRAKGSPQGSDREIPPAAFTLFGDFSKRLMRGMNNDLVKDINPSFSVKEKTLVITGLDILTTRVYD